MPGRERAAPNVVMPLPGAWRAGLLAVALIASLLACQPVSASEDPSRYTYKDTQNLVALVEDAAGLIETEGTAAFGDFSEKGSRWLTGSTYLFVYRLDGTAVFHPISPELVGKNLSGLKDIDGKPVVQEIIAIGGKPERRASGWVFYRWQDQRQLSPIWKSSYVRKAVTPQGEVYLVGSGLYDIKVEKSFVEDRVNLACTLLIRQGKDKAFQTFKDSASPFVFLDTYLFVLNEKGDTLVDPAFPTMGGRHMLDFTDVVGFQPIKALLERLKTTDRSWVEFLWPKPGAVLPSRKLMFAREVMLGGETFIVGADLYVATPIWMKVESPTPWPSNQPG